MRVPALLLAAALALSPGFAQPWAQVRDPAKRETVSLAGLDLTRPTDARTAFVRIKGAVARVCAETKTPVLPHREWRCRQKALTRTLDRLDAPLVRDVAGGRLRER